MKKRKIIVPFKRKRQGKTDYRKRLRLIASNKPRLVVRRALKNIIVQIIESNPKGDKVLVSAHTNELKKNFDWKIAKRNIPTAYLTGLLAGVKAKSKNINEAILDIGLNPPTKGSIFYAALKGAIDAGLKIPHSNEILPTENRIKGEHIANYAKLLSSDKEKYEKQFSQYLKNQIKPEEFSQYFNAVKEKILKGVKNAEESKDKKEKVTR